MGNPLDCGNYRDIKLLSHSLKLWERVTEASLRKIVKIKDNQYERQICNRTHVLYMTAAREVMRIWQKITYGIHRPSTSGL